MSTKPTAPKPNDEQDALQQFLPTEVETDIDLDIEDDLRVSDPGQQAIMLTNVPAVIAPGYFVACYLPEQVASLAADRNMKAAIYGKRSRFDHSRFIVENQDDFPADNLKRLTYKGQVVCVGLEKELDVEAENRKAHLKRLLGGVQDQGRVKISSPSAPLDIK